MQYIVIDKMRERIVTGINSFGKLIYTDMSDFSENGCINITLYNHYEARELVQEHNTDTLDLTYITLQEYYTNPVYKLNA